MSGAIIRKKKSAVMDQTVWGYTLPEISAKTLNGLTKVRA